MNLVQRFLDFLDGLGWDFHMVRGRSVANED